MYWIVAGCLAAVTIPLIFYMWHRYRKAIKRTAQEILAMKQTLEMREHIHKEILEIANYVALNAEFDKALHELLPKFSTLTHSNCCAFYTVNNASRLTIKHSIGFGKNVFSEFDLTIGEGFIGNLALNKDVTIVYDVPDDTVYMIRTFLGKIKPRNVMVVPILHQGQLSGVLVCASINNYTKEDIALVEMLKCYLSIAVENGINAEKNKRLSNELAFQNKLIQNQHEEMRKRLKDKELLIAHLINISEDKIVYVLNADYNVLYWGKSAKAIFGLAKDTALNKNIDQIHNELGWDIIEPALKNMPEDEEYNMQIAGLNGEEWQLTISFSRTGDGGSLGIVAKVRR